MIQTGGMGETVFLGLLEESQATARVLGIGGVFVVMFLFQFSVFSFLIFGFYKVL